MTSRQMLQYAIEKKRPDRVPIDLGGSITGITLSACQELCGYLSLNNCELDVICRSLQLVEPPEPVLEKLGIDTRYIRPNYGIDNRLEDEYVDTWGVTRRLSSNGLYYDIVDYPLKDGILKELERFQWPEPKKREVFRGIREKAVKLFRTSFAVIADPLAPAIFEPAWYLRGMENLLVDFIQSKTYAFRLFDTLLEFQLQFFDAFLSEVGDYVQVVMFGDDLGTQNAPMLSPELYVEMIKPYHKKLFAFVRSRCDAKVFFHSCGAIESLISELIDTGVDIFHPLQPLAYGMDHRLLKEKYGCAICFWGGIDIQQALIGSTDEI